MYDQVMRLILPLVLLPFLSFADEPWDTFGNGKAELSSYKVVQPRYGEDRRAYSVMIFVPEDLNKRTRIKVEDYNSPQAKSRIPVIKLNRVLRFRTGVYDYAVMTSVFSTLASIYGKKEFFPYKISISSTEWCGNFFAQLHPDRRGTQITSHSYFEGEGDVSRFIPLRGDGFYEDNLPVRIRELRGEWMKMGEKKKAKILPSMWSSRINHRKLAWEEGWIQKVKAESIRLFKKKLKAIRWEWKVGSRRETYWVGKNYPHYILKWESSDGSSGRRMATVHRPYWRLNTNTDVSMRKILGLPW